MRLTSIALSLVLCAGFAFAAGTVRIAGNDREASSFDQTSNDPLTGLSASSGGSFCCYGTSQYSAAAAGGYGYGSVIGTHSGFGNGTNVVYRCSQTLVPPKLNWYLSRASPQYTARLS